MKNPFRVHHEILQTLKTEELIFPQFKPFFYNEVPVLWNIQGIRKKTIEHIYTKADLAQDITVTTLTDLFNSLKKRLLLLEKNKPEEFDAVKDYIKQSCGSESMNALQAWLETPFIQSLLHDQTEMDTPVDVAKFYLFAILKSIKDKFGNLSEGSPLTVGEDMLLKFAQSVQFCSTGQRDGLARFYHFLSLAEQNKSLVTTEKQIEQNGKHVISGVSAIMQSALQRTFTNEQLLRQLLGDELCQESHVTQFFMNRYHLQTGYHYQIVFDRYTRVLPGKIFQINLEDFMVAFYEHVPLDYIIQMIKKMKPNWDEIYKLMKSTEHHFNYEVYFDLDQEGTPIQLTDIGALVLLESVGFIRIAGDLPVKK